MIRILFQGDSITDGGRLKDPNKRWDLNHQIGHSYVFYITATLGSKFPGKYDIINRGISGNSVDNLLDRWQTDTLDINPDILSILVGINGNGERDGNFPEGQENHLIDFESKYRKLLITAKESNPDVKLVIMEPFFLPVGKSKEHYDDFMPFFRRKQEIIRQVAADFDAIFIPTQKRLESLVEESRTVLLENGCDIDAYAYWVWDGIHPTEAMHGMMAEWWLEATKDVLFS
jgi:lysophospholipase L1-like esterase